MMTNRMLWLGAYTWMLTRNREDMESDHERTVFALMIAQSLGNGVMLQDRQWIYRQEQGAVLAMSVVDIPCSNAQHLTNRKAGIR